MKQGESRIAKFKMVKEIMDCNYNQGDFVDGDSVLSLLEKSLEDLEKLLREVKINSVLNENKKRD